MSTAYSSPARSSSSYAVTDYLLPATGALLVHALVFWLVAGGFDALRLHEAPAPKVHKVVQASLVTLEKKPSAKRTKHASVQRAKPKVQPKAVKKAVAKPDPKPELKQLSKKVDKPVPVERPKIEEKPVPQTDDLLNTLLAEEDQQLQQDQELSEVARYSAAMTQLIEQYWSRPPSARNGMQVTLVIELVPSGDVVSVNIKQGSGNAAFDRAAVLAVEKIARFDVLQSMPSALFNRYFRKIDLAFRPEDLRL